MQLLSVLRELPSARGHGCVERDSPCVSDAHPGSKVLPACLSCPCCCGSCVLPVSTRQVSAGTPFRHVPQWALLFLPLLLSYFLGTRCTESCSPLCSSHSVRLLLPPAGGAAGCQSSGVLPLGNPAEGLGGSGTEWAGSGSWPEEVTVSPWVSATLAARALRQEGWAVLWWAVCRVQAGTRLSGGSLEGFRRVLQFGASRDMFCRFPVSRRTWEELQHLRANDKF